ncbi:hypothetical protein ABT237_22355 [Streptomyces sp. NPDC001581]|uniref:hypothetical protein n=1 Tax=Streptomyces sp. NPDC001581 TaxID=3154386 RepID=UPI003326C0A1
MVNLGVSLGGLAAVIAVQVDTTFAYSLLIAGNAISFAGCAAVVAMLPRTEPNRTEPNRTEPNRTEPQPTAGKT